MKHKITIHALNISNPMTAGLGTSNIFGNTSLRISSGIPAAPAVDADYLTNLDETDIKQKSVDGIVREAIVVGSSNIPGVHADLIDGFNETNTYAVSNDVEKNVKYIIVYSSDSGNHKYYIKKKEIIPKYDIYSERSYTFYLNPFHIIPVYKKLTTETRTKGGWNIQQWGNALTELKVQGKSGGMHKNYVNIPNATITSSTGTISVRGNNSTDITQSTAWKSLKDLRNLYRYNNSQYADPVTLGLNYFDTFYIGYFTEFSGPDADAEVPYMVDYSFSFKVTQEIPMVLASNNIGNMS